MLGESLTFKKKANKVAEPEVDKNFFTHKYTYITN